MVVVRIHVVKYTMVYHRHGEERDGAVSVRVELLITVIKISRALYHGQSGPIMSQRHPSLAITNLAYLFYASWRCMYVFVLIMTVMFLLRW